MARSRCRAPGPARIGGCARGDPTDEIEAIASDDPDRELRTSSAFALSRCGDGFDQLVRIARTSKDRDIERSAFFRLGQSKDPRAVEFLAAVLSRP